MVHVRWGFALALVASVTLGLVAGCQVTTPGKTCAQDNAPCDFDADCCSQVCASDGFCGADNTCAQDDAACNVDTDCCSQLCASDGFCGPDDTCAQDDAPCDFDADCCSQFCASDGFCGVPNECVGGSALQVCPARLIATHEVGVTSCPQSLGTVTVRNGGDQPFDVECTGGFYLTCALSSATVPAQGEVTAEIAFNCSTTEAFATLVAFQVVGGADAVDLQAAVVFGSSCGDGVCDFAGDEPTSCPEDCCGDGFCDPGEDAVCPIDCG